MEHDRRISRPRATRSEVPAMPWIPHLMILDDDSRVLDSLVPSVADEVARLLGRSSAVSGLLRPDEPGATGPIHLKVTAHGYESDRVAGHRYRTPVHAHLH